ncbi:MAG: SOS response-associated peptidase family protein [Gammaproteobacteria bacterium]|nr:SOS response-associated peptidase family protein [Gammaproteobacteria bacterium]
MCTNFVFVRSNGTTRFADHLGLDPESAIYGDHMPAARISIVLQTSSVKFEFVDAIWWLFLRQTDKGLQPHKDYFSVNTNHAKLPSRPEYKLSRCIIPATGFVESQSGRAPHLLERADGQVIVFGGLYKKWTDKQTGEVVHSASIITLPGVPALADIHRKSLPLWLPDHAIHDWLNPQITDPKPRFESLLEPALRANLIATPIKKTTLKEPVGESFLISS